MKGYANSTCRYVISVMFVFLSFSHVHHHHHHVSNETSIIRNPRLFQNRQVDTGVYDPTTAAVIGVSSSSSFFVSASDEVNSISNQNGILNATGGQSDDDDVVAEFSSSSSSPTSSSPTLPPGELRSLQRKLEQQLDSLEQQTIILSEGVHIQVTLNRVRSHAIAAHRSLVQAASFLKLAGTFCALSGGVEDNEDTEEETNNELEEGHKGAQALGLGTEVEQPREEEKDGQGGLAYIEAARTLLQLVVDAREVILKEHLEIARDASSVLQHYQQQQQQHTLSDTLRAEGEDDIISSITLDPAYLRRLAESPSQRDTELVIASQLRHTYLMSDAIYGLSQALVDIFARLASTAATSQGNSNMNEITLTADQVLDGLLKIGAPRLDVAQRRVLITGDAVRYQRLFPHRHHRRHPHHHHQSQLVSDVAAASSSSSSSSSPVADLRPRRHFQAFRLSPNETLTPEAIQNLFLQALQGGGMGVGESGKTHFRPFSSLNNGTISTGRDDLSSVLNHATIYTIDATTGKVVALGGGLNAGDGKSNNKQGESVVSGGGGDGDADVDSMELTHAELELLTDMNQQDLSSTGNTSSTDGDWRHAANLLQQWLQTVKSTVADGAAAAAAPSPLSSLTSLLFSGSKDAETASSSDDGGNTQAVEAAGPPAPTPTPRPDPYPEYPEIPTGVNFPLAVNNLLECIHVPHPLASPTAPTVEEASVLRAAFLDTARRSSRENTNADQGQEQHLSSSSSSSSSSAGSSLFQLNKTAIEMAKQAREQDRQLLVDAGVIAAKRMPSPSEITDDVQFARAEAVRRAFEHAWEGYARSGFGDDIFHPLTNSTGSDLCKMGETLVDSLDTVILMGLATPYFRSEEWVREVFPTLIGGQADINLFECTIRIVGGLLAAHDLSTLGSSGEMSSQSAMMMTKEYAKNGESLISNEMMTHFAATSAAAATTSSSSSPQENLKDSVFLQGAELVMRAMFEAGAFASTTGLPYGTLYLTPRNYYPHNRSSILVQDHDVPEYSGTGVRVAGGHAYNPAWTSGSSSLSEVATLQLELAALSHHTGVVAYHKAGRRVMKHLANLAPANGLYPIYIDPATGLLKDVVITLGARGDSTYEYMLKQWIYAGGWSFEEERAKSMASLIVEMVMPVWEKEQHCHAEAAAGAAEATADGNPSINTENVAALNALHTAQAASFPPLPDPDPQHLQRLADLGLHMANVLSRAEDEDPRFILRMYNTAIVGIMDRLTHISSPSNYTYIAEQTHSSATMPGQSPALVHKMDHLVCFLPGLMALGVAHGAGHEMLAVEAEVVRRSLAFVEAIEKWQIRTGRVWFAPVDVPVSTPTAADQQHKEQEEQQENVVDSTSTGTGKSSSGGNNDSRDDDGGGKEKGTSGGVSIHVPLPPHFDTPYTIPLLQRMLHVMDLWLTPAGLSTLKTDIFTSHVQQSTMKSAPCPPPLSSSSPSAQTTQSRKGLNQKEGSNERNTHDMNPHSSENDQQGNEELLVAQDDEVMKVVVGDEENNHPHTTEPLSSSQESYHSLQGSFYPDPSFDPFASMRDPEAIRTLLAHTAKELVKTCVSMSSFTTTGLAPEIITFTPGRDFLPNHDARHCLLRPETIESLFYMHRLTNDTIYADWAWNIFDSIELHARVRSGGYASVSDADVANLHPFSMPSAGKANMNDKMESFHLAETLKYLYLIFAPNSRQILPLREWVFNTEAHPLKVVK